MKKYIISISIILTCVSLAFSQESYDRRPIRSPFNSADSKLGGGSQAAELVTFEKKGIIKLGSKIVAIIKMSVKGKSKTTTVQKGDKIDISDIKPNSLIEVKSFTNSEIKILVSPINKVVKIKINIPENKNIDRNNIDFLEFNKLDLGTAIRELSLLTGKNIIITPKAASKNIQIILQNLPADTMIESLCQISDVWYRDDYKNKIMKLMTLKEYSENIKIKPDIETKFFTLLYPNAEVVAAQIEALYKRRAIVDYGTDGTFTSNSRGNSKSSNSNRSSSSFSSSRNAGGNLGGIHERINRNDINIETAKAIEKSRTSDSKNNTNKNTIDTVQKNFNDKFPIYVSINKPNNMIVVRTGDRDAVKQIAHLIKSLDKPTPQVLLEVKIIEVVLGDGFDSVFDFSLSSGDISNPSANDKNTIRSLGSLLNSSTFAYRYLDKHIRMRLELMEHQQRIHKLSSPLLLCANNEEATIFDGEQRPLVRSYSVQSITNNNQSNQLLVPVTEIVNVGTTLKIVPKINADKSVTMSIQQTVSSFTENGAQFPVLDNSNNLQYVNIDTTSETTVNAIVLAKDGMTVALGGLVQTSESIVQQKVPILGDLDYLGFFFKKDVRRKSRRERILLITPYVLAAPKDTESFTNKKMKEISNSTLYKNEKNSNIHFPISVRRKNRARNLSKYLKP